MNDMSMFERMRAGQPYRADGPEIQQRAERAHQLCHRINTADPTCAAISVWFREFLGLFGEGAAIRPPFYCDYGEHFFFGARSFANFGLVVLDVADVIVGEDCQLGPNVQLLTATHPVEPEPRRDKWESARPITLGDNIWLGGGVVVGPGVSIGDNSVVGAGSVVTRNLPANVVAVGSPARVIRQL